MTGSRDRTPVPGILWIGVGALLAMAGGYFGCVIGNERRIALDEAAGISWKEPIFTDLEMGGFFAGSCVGIASGLLLFLRSRKARKTEPSARPSPGRSSR